VIANPGGRASYATTGLAPKTKYMSISPFPLAAIFPRYSTMKCSRTNSQVYADTLTRPGSQFGGRMRGYFILKDGQALICYGKNRFLYSAASRNAWTSPSPDCPARMTPTQKSKPPCSGPRRSIPIYIIVT
jgi:hypothetical protein